VLPNLIKPMLAVESREPFDSDRHLFEIKWDGIRCLAFIENGRARLQSRESIDITAQFPELVGLADLPGGTVLDGELVAMENGKPSLGGIQRRVQLQDQNRIALLSQASPVVYVVFDLLYLRGESTIAQPLLERRQALERLVSASRADRMILSEAVIGQGRDLFRAVGRLGLEGVMAKSLDGQYRPGKRTALWRKIKRQNYARLNAGLARTDKNL
jgi:ATP-dependent DNA ligase